MTVQLTKRDKILIYVMSIVIVVFAFVWFLIIPQMDRSSELDMEIAQLESEKIPMEAAILSLETIKTRYNNSYEEYLEEVEPFFTYLQNYEIDKFITNLITNDYNLVINSLSMSEIPYGLNLSRYYASPTIEGEETTEIDVENIPLLSSSIKILASGNKDNMTRLIDDLFASYYPIRVTGYTISSDNTTTNLELYLDIYMIRE